MVAGAFSFLPPFFAFFSPAGGGEGGPSPLACFFSGFSSLVFLSSAMWNPYWSICAPLRLATRTRLPFSSSLVLLRVAAALVVALEDHQLLHDGPLLLVVDVQHLAGLPLLPAGEDVHHVAFLDPRRALHG